VTPLGRRRQERLHIDKRLDGRGNPYYWIAYSRLNPFQGEHGSDIAVLEERRIAVTPLRIDITDEPTMTRLAELFENGI
jgi:5'-nucleotidase